MLSIWITHLEEKRKVQKKKKERTKEKENLVFRNPIYTTEDLLRFLLNEIYDCMDINYFKNDVKMTIGKKIVVSSSFFLEYVYLKCGKGPKEKRFIYFFSLQITSTMLAVIILDFNKI